MGAVTDAKRRTLGQFRSRTSHLPTGTFWRSWPRHQRRAHALRKKKTKRARIGLIPPQFNFKQAATAHCETPALAFLRHP
jgi:hypothetical protein